MVSMIMYTIQLYLTMGMLVIITILCSLSSVQASPEMEGIPSSMMMNTFWNDWVEENILPSVRVSQTSSNDSQCFREIEKIFAEGGRKRTIILDATGKPTSGLLEGNLAWLGNYRQCVDTSGLQYCLISAPISTSGKNRLSGFATLGACVPDECNENDVLLAVNEVQKLLFGNDTRNHMVDCSETLNPSSDPGFICTMIFLSLLCALCICATAYESYWSHRSHQNDEERTPILDKSGGSCNGYHRSEPKTHDYRELPASKRSLICFSLTRSVNQITNTTSAKDDITCLHGLRVISMFWIILGHSMSYQQNSGAMADPMWVYSVPAKWFTSQAVYNAYVALDTFFFLGGLLAAYTGFKYMSKSVGRVNWFAAIVHRYLRITPAMAVMILLYTFVYPYFGEGPFWYKRVEECHECYEWWWTNFLYINNFVPENTSGGCLSWSWYLATDMQLFLVSIIIIVLLWWAPMIGIAVLALTTSASIVVLAVVYSLRNYAATQIIGTITGGHDGPMFPFTVKPYACATAYMIGIGMGYCLHIMKNKAVRRLNVITVLIGWLLSFGIGMSLVYGLYGVFNYPGLEFVPPEEAVNVVYASLKGLAWAVALCWVVFACHYGYGGVINRFLSWSFWIPLSRLTFCAYLLHPAIIYLYTGTLTMTFNVIIVHQSILFAGFVTISYSSAFVLSALVEMPICNLQKMLLKR